MGLPQGELLSRPTRRTGGPAVATEGAPGGEVPAESPTRRRHTRAGRGLQALKDTDRPLRVGSHTHKTEAPTEGGQVSGTPARMLTASLYEGRPERPGEVAVFSNAKSTIK